MSYYLYKLKFTTPVRFGTDKKSSGLDTTACTCHGDTMYSAICNEWRIIHGEESLNRLVEDTNDGKFIISDLMPYKVFYSNDGEEIIDIELYLPKPVLYVERSEALQVERDNTNKKKMKKITHIPITKFRDYLKFLKDGDVLPVEEEIFGSEEVRTNAAISYKENSLPYYIASFRFAENTGLYFIVKVSDQVKEDFDEVLYSLKDTGIGGKRSSGFGKFEFLDDEIELVDGEGIYKSDEVLSEMLYQGGDYIMNLSPVLPDHEDLKKLANSKNYYQLILRKGFIYSSDYSNRALKKKQVVMFNSGSCFEQPLKGRVAQVAKDGNHKVYRYGKSLFVGVNL